MKDATYRHNPYDSTHNSEMLKLSSDGYSIHVIKGKVHPIIGHKNPEGEERQSFNLGTR